MELTLTNFRCYRDRHSFTFSQAFVLLLGKTASGKSTILDAITFLLFGKGKNCATLNETFYGVEMAFEGATIKRTKNSLLFTDSGGTYSDVVAQDKIFKMFGKQFLSYASRFFEMAPRDQLEMLEETLFDGQIDIKELKAKFGAEKRGLEAVSKDLGTKRAMTQEFLRKLGPVVDARLYAGNPEELKHRLWFLQNRLRLKEAHAAKMVQTRNDIAELEQRLDRAQKLADIPYSAEQLQAHIEACHMFRTQLKDWERYSYTVAECDNEIENYEDDRQTLLTYQCPVCSSVLSLSDHILVVANRSNEDNHEVLENLGAETVSGGLDIICEQIQAYVNFRARRQQIDEYKANLLPISYEQASHFQINLKKRQKEQVEAEIFDEQLEERRKQLTGLLEAAERAELETWEDSKDVANIVQQLQNIELQELRTKETIIRSEYQTELDSLSVKESLCGARQRGLARASTILAETEQEYLGEMIENVVSEMNRLLSLVFQERECSFDMVIEGTANGVRKLRIMFARQSETGWSYDMFSGGEKARINICLQLVFAKIQSYKILLLDEFSRYLDKETAQTVVDVVRANFQGMIIAAEHESDLKDVQIVKLNNDFP